MGLSLDDLMKLPEAPTPDHLAALGLLKPPQPEPPPMVPPAKIAKMTPAEAQQLPLESALHPKMAMSKADPNAAPDSSLDAVMGAAPGSTQPEESPMFHADHSLPELGFKQKMALPTMSAAVRPDTSQFYENERERQELAKQNPWGSAENHPGLLGKIGHVAAKVGNVAGDILAPAVMANIPGTELNRHEQELATQKNLAAAQTRESEEKNRASEEGLRKAQQENLESEIREREGKSTQELVQDAQGNVTGWKDKHGLHSLQDADTPQSIKDIAADAQNKLQKPTFQEDKQGNIVALTTDKDGKTSSEVVYHGTPGQKLEVKPIVGADGHAHDLVFDMNQKNPDGSIGLQVGDLGRSKEDKAPSLTSELAKAKAGEQLVRGFDKDGNERMMPKSQADEEGLSHVSKATDKEWDDAKQNTAALNDMGAKVKNTFDSAKALDQGVYQKTLIQTALKGDPDDYRTRFAISMMSELSKQYVQDVHSLREAALALPKQTTGGSRVSEPQAKALWNTISGSSGDSKYAISQLYKFDENLARLWKKVPQIEGQTRERPFGEQTSGKKEEKPTGGGASTAPEPPKGKTTVYDQQGAAHFVLSNKVDDFLKDPKYKGWSKNAPTK